MPSLIEKIISGNWTDSDTGQKLSVPIKEIIIGKNAAEKGVEVIKNIIPYGKIAIISDQNTHVVLGKNIEELTAKYFQIRSVILSGEVKPGENRLEEIKYNVQNCSAIIAVGSGTINDLCKYASFQLDKPYIIFGTAPSMNGYVSANASIIVNNNKTSLSAHLPQAIFLDLDILANAPMRLIRSGLGDSICRSTSQADWLLSHFLLGTDYKSAPFELLKEHEPVLIKKASLLAERNIEAIEVLAETLILSGIGMYVSGGSYPASQGEHMIAHLMESIYDGESDKSYHGEQIAVTTLTMAEIQNRILSKEQIEILPTSFDKNNFIKDFGRKIGEKYFAEAVEKIISVERAREINSLLSKNWPVIGNKIKQITLSYDVIRDTLISAGCYIIPGDLGWNNDTYNKSVKLAHLTRSRFTFLDLENQVVNLL